MASSTEKDEIESILSTYFTIPVGADYDKKVLETLSQFEVRDSDVFLIGHPKTGTTWGQEMIWLIGNDLDFEGSKTFIDERFPILEIFSFFCISSEPNIPTYYADSIGYINKQKSPRFIKTHLRGTYLPQQLQDGSKKPKVIYIARDAKDTCLSMYHYFKNLLHIYNGTLEDFCKVFIAGRIGQGSFWDHVLYFWNRRHESNIMFIKYADMKNNLPEVLRQLSRFLDKTITEEQVATLTKRLDIDSMKKNSAVNHDHLYQQSGFIRSGKVGGFKEEMSPDIINRFDAWTQKSLLGFDLKL